MTALKRPQLLRKISPRTVFGDKGDVLALVIADRESEIPLFRVKGSCVGTRKGFSDFGEWISLVGDFLAINMHTGELFAGGECFLPDYLARTVYGKLNGDVTSVTFGYEVTAGYDEKSATSYVYGARMFEEPSDVDPRLLELVSGTDFGQPKLAAPEPETKTIAEKK